MNNFTQNNWNGNNTMNFGPQPRRLDVRLEEQLKEKISSGAKVEITSVLGDGEAFNFANQIKDFLEKEGYTVSGVHQGLYSKPINGQIIELPKEGDNTYKIIIGGRE